jgi:hypothetical protein
MKKIVYFLLDTKISEESVFSNQSLLFLRSAVCLAEKQQIPIL